MSLLWDVLDFLYQQRSEFQEQFYNWLGRSHQLWDKYWKWCSEVGKSADKIWYFQTRSEIREVLQKIAFLLLENFRFLSSTIQASCSTSLQPQMWRRCLYLWIVGKFSLLKQKPPELTTTTQTKIQITKLTRQTISAVIIKDRRRPLTKSTSKWSAVLRK